MEFVLCFCLLCALFSSLPLLNLKPFLMQFFGDMVEKSYMFLLCNGLLVLIAMNSGLISASSPPTLPHAEFKDPHIALSAHQIESPQPQEEHHLSETLISDTHEDEEDGNALAIIPQDDHDHGVDDTQELNKKCEDFIKMMKATFSSNNLDLRPTDTFYFYQKSLVAVNY
ncbi:hypothetical protein VNO78_32149 [Psophocarpus tetragonolobus]|uniref:Uncharacterized protein n=1 Tax=Psophocarpus tetragonolobus TaxID=3891 RepID=A0AAN9X9A2_PSOTE